MNENFDPNVTNEQPAPAPAPAPAAPVKENVGMGILGAFLFSLSGGIVWFLLYMMGYIAAISGIVGVFCAIKGYGLFAKKQSVKGIVIGTVFAFVVIVIAWYMGIAYDVCTVFNVTFGEALSEVHTLFSNSEVASGLWSDLGLGLLFCAVGCFATVKTELSKLKK